jgi:DNA-3-methyladenine glycosylase
VLVHQKGTTVAAGVIVEVEAYIGESDPACHAAPGPTTRNAPLYGPPGHAYVYLNYGIHSLMNVVTEREGYPAAVLIRALEPLEGPHLMRRRRRRPSKGRRSIPSALPDAELCRGPGNLTMAMGITLGENRLDLVRSRLWVEDRGQTVGPIVWTPRVGIRVGADRLWRAHVRDHPSVSGPRMRLRVDQRSAGV